MARLIDRASTTPGNCSFTNVKCTRMHTSRHTYHIVYKEFPHASIYTSVDLKARVCVFTAGKHQDRWHTVKYRVETGVAIKARSLSLSPPLSNDRSAYSISLFLFLFFAELTCASDSVFMYSEYTRLYEWRAHGYLESMRKEGKTWEALKRIIWFYRW